MLSGIPDNNGKWCWWSCGIGGRSALDYLIHVCNKTLPDAVLQLNGMAVLPPTCRPDSFSRPVEPKKLLLPEKNDFNDRVIAYLAGRGIDRRLIDYCIKTGRLYESHQLFDKGIHYNAVFVGFGTDGNPKYAAIRGTENRRFMMEANGSDKHYSSTIPARNGSSSVHLFESAIDRLSYCTLELRAGRDWQVEHCLSLAGIYKPRQRAEESTPPAALIQFLEDCPDMIDTITMHLDNDEPGRLATRAIQALLSKSYTISDEPPKHRKDVNDELCMILKECRERIKAPER
ncbi:DUF3991 domain-containing protein [Ethanoligenens sp.]|uniref:DUF3991 domain-containing protein n=1 Tax=Ethanoligenens sp. TaxID=2099655 RepID=UPI0039E96C88